MKSILSAVVLVAVFMELAALTDEKHQYTQDVHKQGVLLNGLFHAQDVSLIEVKDSHGKAFLFNLLSGDSPASAALDFCQRHLFEPISGCVEPLTRAAERVVQQQNHTAPRLSSATITPAAKVPCMHKSMQRYESIHA